MLAEFYYLQVPGPDGGIEVIDGGLAGKGIGELVEGGLPPFKVCLEIAAALCAIVEIACEDGEVHGDIDVEHIALGSDGAVCIGGYGVHRRRSRAPEGAPKGARTDLYGLGKVIFRLFNDRDLSNLPDDPDGHDDAVIDAIVATNFDGVPEEMVGDIQWYVAKLMAYDREDRPEALTVWRTMVAFADGVEGQGLAEWAVQASEGGGVRRDVADAAAESQPVEELGGPVVSQGPLSSGAISFNTSKGSANATAFWSKDQMKAALDGDDEERKPQEGGGNITGFWSIDQIKAMKDGATEAPRPARSGASGSKPAPQKPYSPAPAATPAPTETKPEPPAPVVPKPAPPPPPKPAPPPPPKPAPPPEPEVAFVPEVTETEVNEPPPLISGRTVPVAQPSPRYEDFESYDEPAGDGGKKAIIAAAVGLVLFVICAGVIGVGGIFIFSGSGSDAQTEEKASTEYQKEVDEEANNVADSGDDKGDNTSEDEGDVADERPSSGSGGSSGTKKSSNSSSGSSSAKKSSNSSSGSSSAKKSSNSSSGSSSAKKSSGSSSTKKSTPPATPAAPVASVDAELTVKADDRGLLRCMNGMVKKFDGPVSMTIPAGDLPVTCVVMLDNGKKGAFSVSTTKTFNCTSTGTKASCK